MQPEFCSREKLLYCFKRQQNEKPTSEASQTKFPLILSWAITIHKVQGLTLNAVVVDMAKSKGDYQCGQAYVAFSCIKQLSGLHMVKYTWEQIKADECINQFMESNRARQIAHIQPALTKNPNTRITVIHQNVQGLTPHQKDIDGHTALKQHTLYVCQRPIFSEGHHGHSHLLQLWTFILNEVRGQYHQVEVLQFA